MSHPRHASVAVDCFDLKATRTLWAQEELLPLLIPESPHPQTDLN